MQAASIYLQSNSKDDLDPCVDTVDEFYFVQVLYQHFMFTLNATYMAIHLTYGLL